MTDVELSAMATPLVELDIAQAQTENVKSVIEYGQLDADAVRIVLRLRQYGYEAYLVGGCVRDLLLQRTPKDFDIATNARPRQIRALFRNCRLIGRRFRLVHVFSRQGRIFEVSTFRADPGTSQESGDLLIRRDNVFGSAQEDVCRRDFTINGLFFDPQAACIIDFVDGYSDLKKGLLRTIGDPEIRMREDPVRILRAVRFVCKLGFEIEPPTYAAMKAAVGDLPKCSSSRLVEEMFRLLRGGIAKPALQMLMALGALELLFPPLWRFLNEATEEERETFFACVSALDTWLADGKNCSDAVILACLMMVVANPFQLEQQEENMQKLQGFLRELKRDICLPKRVAEGCRNLLLVQRFLAGQRKYKGGLHRFREYVFFEEAMLVFEVWNVATGQFSEELRVWKEGREPALKASAKRPKRRKPSAELSPENGLAAPDGVQDSGFMA
ncbi:MAG: polynucleotide adenylyltransferase PcnB [Proteobacteria bacterium]|nr:polynucleotide adenylyltransferase PcnB [Cystobacterineae bacterium]MCL2258259.1 polynucleotide adenylyltransferase PcnB [Cystobacterineae bacterium]MCL2315420.1 polynucleotide adenylyltransferase PcnB [Pseudomonadota bacterium]